MSPSPTPHGRMVDVGRQHVLPSQPNGVIWFNFCWFLVNFSTFLGLLTIGEQQDAPAHSESTVADLRCVDFGERFSAGEHGVAEVIPPMPSSHLQELEMWVNNRNCEQECIGVRGTSTIARVGAPVGQGTEALTSLTSVVPMEGTTRHL